MDALKVHEGCSQMLIVEELGCKRMASFQDGHLLTTEFPPHPFNTKTMSMMPYNAEVCYKILSRNRLCILHLNYLRKQMFLED